MHLHGDQIGPFVQMRRRNFHGEEANRGEEVGGGVPVAGIVAHVEARDLDAVEVQNGAFAKQQSDVQIQRRVQRAQLRYTLPAGIPRRCGGGRARRTGKWRRGCASGSTSRRRSPAPSTPSEPASPPRYTARRRRGRRAGGRRRRASRSPRRRARSAITPARSSR